MFIMQGNQWLEEARRIRAEQDQSFAKSLAVDQAKVAMHVYMVYYDNLLRSL